MHGDQCGEAEAHGRNDPTRNLQLQRSRLLQLLGAPATAACPMLDVNRADFSVNGRAVLIQDVDLCCSNHAVGTSAHAWDSAFVLASFLESNPATVHSKRVVELGAGQAVVGVAAAIMGGDVTVTDHPLAMEVVERSVARNGAGLDLRAAALDWVQLETEALDPPFDVILAADVVWMQELIVPLVKTFGMLADHTTSIFLSYQERTLDSSAALFEALASEGFKWEPVKEPKFHLRLSSPKINIYLITRRSSAVPVVKTKI